MKFKELKFRKLDEQGGVQAFADFDNGYTASVIRHLGSHGYEDGLYEIALFRGDDLVHVDEWSDQVKGWLTPEGVEDALAFIENIKI